MAWTWIFRNPFEEEQEAFLALVEGIVEGILADVEIEGTQSGELHVLRATLADEDEGRAFWLELHSRCLDANLALELCETDATDWQPLAAVLAAVLASDLAAAPLARRAAHAPEVALSPLRPDIPEATLYDLLRADDPELEPRLAETAAWIGRNGLPLLNLLSYLELPMFLEYAAEHPDERDQNLYLHMLHTWTCYRSAGAVTARIGAELAAALTDPRFLRLNTTQFRSPADAFCLQLPAWEFACRPQWAKEIYVTHLPPPTPAEDRELTLMVVTHDARGDFGFVPLEIPLSLPAVGDSIEAFFAPGLGDDELGANSEDLLRIARIAAAYSLYATASDRARYLTGSAG